MLRLISFIILLYSTLSHADLNSVEELQTLVDEKKYLAAIAAGELILEQHPQWSDIQFLTAYVYQMNQQTGKALAMYRDLISQRPELPEPRNNLAMIYLEKGDYDAASKLLVEAINTHPSYATAYQNLSRIYTGIASEAYRRALSESEEPAKYTHIIELAALSQLEPVGQNRATAMPGSEGMNSGATIQADLKSILGEQIKQWARAWSNKDFTTYASFYSTEHRPNFKTHSAWVDHRRRRIMRPEFIKIGVSDIQIRTQNDNWAVIDLEQTYDSPSYSDRVKKRLSFRRIGSEWKITDERVLSAL